MRSSITGVLAMALFAGCSGEEPGPAPAGDAPQATRAPQPVAPEQMPAELVEPGGIHWRKTRLVTPVMDDDGAEVVSPPAPPGAATPTMTMEDMPVEEAARRLQPVMLWNGVEYEASPQDALRIAASAQAAARSAKARRLKADDGDVATVRQAALTANPRVDISDAAASQPYINIGMMSRRHRDENDALKWVTDYCTCFKSNQYTCVTAAHCVANNWRKRHPNTWKNLSKIQFGAAASGRLDEIDPVPAPYAVVISKGYWFPDLDESNGAIVGSDFAVIRFRGAYTAPPNADGSLTPWNWPTNLPNVPEALYNTGQPGHLVLSSVIPDIDVLSVRVVGYPGDMVGHLMYSDGVLRPPNDSSILNHQASAFKGESGGPLIMRDATRPNGEVVGIHHGEGSPGWNWAVQLTDLLKDWVEAVSGY
jgi:V8-like Glu-specific endopeptidase